MELVMLLVAATVVSAIVSSFFILVAIRDDLRGLRRDVRTYVAAARVEASEPETHAH